MIDSKASGERQLQTQSKVTAHVGITSLLKTAKNSEVFINLTYFIHSFVLKVFIQTKAKFSDRSGIEEYQTRNG